MKLIPKILMDHYIDTIEDDYPHLSREEIKVICRSQFDAVYDEIASGSLKTIRLKYFGIFTVFKARAIGMLKRLHQTYEDGNMLEEEFLIRKKNVERKIKSYEKEDH